LGVGVADRGYRPACELIGCFLLAWVLEHHRVDDEDATWDDRFAESEDAVIGVCWYYGAKLRDGHDYDVVCRECLGEEES
jgi:hypothetical protein